MILRVTQHRRYVEPGAEEDQAPVVRENADGPAIPKSTLELREKDQSCHHEVWVHLSHVNALPDERVPRYNQPRHLHVKERKSPYDYSKEGKRAH